MDLKNIRIVLEGVSWVYLCKRQSSVSSCCEHETKLSVPTKSGNFFFSSEVSHEGLRFTQYVVEV
jgi:hypothetical protein